MFVRDGMTTTLASVGPTHTLRDAARLMANHNCGAAVVYDPDAPGPQMLTEHDILVALSRGEDPDRECVTNHPDVGTAVVSAAPSWSLEQAASVMVDRGWRHLVVCDDGDVVGVLSMRDIVRCWTRDGATCDMPGGASDGKSAHPLRSWPESNPEIDEAKLGAGRAVLDSVMGF